MASEAAKSNKRIEIFDIAKGIAIILVVIAHLGIPEFWRKFIFLFHMPFFFFIAGYFFKEKYYATLKDVLIYIKKRFLRLFCVYLGFNAIFILLHNFFININVYKLSTDKISYSESFVPYYNSFNDMLKALVTHVEPLIQPIWFLFALFFVAVIFAVISYVSKKCFKDNEWLRFIVILCFSQIGFWLYFHKINAAYIGTVCSVLSIYYFGYLASKTDINKFCSAASFVLSFILLTVINIFTHKSVGLESNFYYNIGFLFLTTTLGVTAIFTLSKYIAKYSSLITKFLSIIGENTMPILILHFSSFKLINVLIILIYGYSFDKLYLRYINTDIFWTLVYLISGVCIPVVLNIWYKRIKSELIKI